MAVKREGESKGLYFGSPDWQGVELQQQARMLQRALIGAAAISVLILVFAFETFKLHPVRSVLIVWTMAVILASLLLIRRMRIHLAGQLMTYGFWLSLLVLVVNSGGLYSPWVLAQLSLVVVSGIIFSGSAAIGLAVLTLIVDLGIYAFQVGGLIPSVPPDFTDSLSAVFASFAMAALTMHLARKAVQQTIVRAQENEQRYRSLFEETNDAVFQVDDKEVIISVNQRAADMLSYEIDELVGLPYSHIVAANEKTRSDENFGKLLEENTLPLFERTMVRKDGSRVTVEFSASVVRDSQGKVIYYQGVARNVTERKLLEQQLKESLAEMEKTANTDPLTGMLNRRAISARAEIEWHKARRDGRPLSLMVLDVDDFKEINDQFGHQVGDDALCILAVAIRGAIRQGGERNLDWAGRWGGDEFLIVLPGASLPAAEEIAERLHSLVADKDIDLGNGKLGKMSLSLGAACYSARPGDELSLDRLLAQADQALYKAKEAGRNQVAVFRDKIEEE